MRSFCHIAASLLPSIPKGMRRHQFLALQQKSSQILFTCLITDSISVLSKKTEWALFVHNIMACEGHHVALVWQNLSSSVHYIGSELTERINAFPTLMIVSFLVLYSVFKVQYFLTAHVALTVYHYFSKLICKQPQVICKVSLPKLFKLLCYFMMQSALRLTIYNRVTSWRWGDSNSWPPACKAGALPTELHPRLTN